MDNGDKHQLEGLLKARADGMRNGRSGPVRPDANRSPTAVRYDNGVGVPAPARRCAECGAEISPLRLRAMPRAGRCLACQRAAERAAART